MLSFLRVTEEPQDGQGTDSPTYVDLLVPGPPSIDAEKESVHFPHSTSNNVN